MTSLSLSLLSIFPQCSPRPVVNSYHLLTAGHDADKLVPPITIDASTGRETLPMMNGVHKQIKAGDMMMTDAKGNARLFTPDAEVRHQAIITAS